MKKQFMVLMMSALWLGICVADLSSAPGRGFNIGAITGGTNLFSYYVGYKFGGELGFEVTDRFGLRAEYSYASASYSHEMNYADYQYSGTDEFTLPVISLSVLMCAPIGNGSAVYVGAGAGYYPLKVKNYSKYTSFFGESYEDSEEKEFRTTAPHFMIGIETKVTNRAAFFGEARYSVRKGRYEGEDSDVYTNGQDLPFGGAELRIGMRIYLGSRGAGKL
jgi:hypothetical protein